MSTKPLTISQIRILSPIDPIIYSTITHIQKTWNKQLKRQQKRLKRIQKKQEAEWNLQKAILAQLVFERVINTQPKCPFPLMLLHNWIKRQKE
jgi:hypothetical protein